MGPYKILNNSNEEDTAELYARLDRSLKSGMIGIDRSFPPGTGSVPLIAPSSYQGAPVV
ncbi:MAG: hypothetical protein U0V54_10735 [Saprospiraceae bacterium]|nr:hypothetical protein [Saprospiraceae bacterium]